MSLSTLSISMLISWIWKVIVFDERCKIRPEEAACCSKL